jgi:hypothetical protein
MNPDFLPLEASTVVGDYAFAAEAGRNFVQYAPSQWIAGIAVGHSCGANLECVGEVHNTSSPHDSQTLVNLGVHWRLKETLFVLAAAGREFGPRTDNQERLRFYIGIQLLR